MSKVHYCKKTHRLTDGAVTLLGALEEVTPTMTLVELGATSFLVDCGDSDEDSPLPDEAIDVSALIITHAHNDHIGGVPRLLKAGFGGPIYATAATLEIARALLRDGIRLNGGSRDDVRAFIAGFDYLARPVRYDNTFEVKKGSGIDATFREAGHILGSASVELRSGESRVIISGDLGRPGSPILRDYNTKWDEDRPVDLVLMETTYGDREQEALPADLEDRLELTINNALKDGGHILVPSFAIGRTQVLLYLLNSLVESGKVKNLPVAIDTPLGLKVTKTYKDYKKIYDKESLNRIAMGDDPLDFDDLYEVWKGRDSSRLDHVKESMLIIAGSGMCSGGRIVGHLKELLPLKETNLVFVGHQAYGTQGRAIQDAAKLRKHGEAAMVRLNGEEIELRAAVETLPGISAHADRKELGEWLRAIPNVQKIALHHGDKHSQEGFAKWLSEY
jgi:metallo-beta-lactamase family protein